MRLARYRFLIDEIRKDELVLSFTDTITFYRFFNERWYDEADEFCSDPKLITQLEYTRTTEHSWRNPKSTSAFCWIDDLAAVAVSDFSSPPKKKTYDSLKNRIVRAIQVAGDSYGVAHDELTGLLSRRGFTDHAKKEINSLKEERALSSNEELASTQDHVSLVSFDADHFKQINDSFGHQYGDVVLKTLALRVEGACQQIRKERPAIRIAPARPSGEEFIVMVSGSYTLGEEFDIAEQIRTAISAKHLPDEEEFRILGGYAPNATLALPRTSERNVTVSLGTATLTREQAAGDPEDIVERLKSMADAALYRAKEAGRNQTVRYQDILSRYGRVLECHRETRIVAINIGKKVGVALGQEFNVFNPTFSGATAFMMNDGRTSKRLGSYPRVPSCRIEVFDVQPEISFCRIPNDARIDPIVIGSTLEAIPLGSITHLLAGDQRVVRGVLLRQDIEKKIVELGKAETPYACVISLANVDDLAAAYGTAYVNKVLASIYDLLGRSIDPSGFIGQISPSEFAAVTATRSAPADENIRSVISGVRNEFANLPSIRAGIFTKTDADSFSKDGGGLDSVSALDFAQFANAAVDDEQLPIKHFDRDVPNHILYRSRMAGELGRAEKDYDAFQKLRALDGLAENQMALAYSAAGLFDKADQAIRRAVAAAPDDAILHLNGASIAYSRRQYREGLDYYRRFLELDAGFKLTAHYLVRVAFMAYEVWKADHGDNQTPLQLMKQVIAHEKVGENWRSFARGAVEKLQAEKS